MKFTYFALLGAVDANTVVAENSANNNSHEYDIVLNGGHKPITWG